MAEHEDVEIRFARLEDTVGTLSETVNRRFDGVDAVSRSPAVCTNMRLKPSAPRCSWVSDAWISASIASSTLDQFVDTQSKTNEG